MYSFFAQLTEVAVSRCRMEFQTMHRAACGKPLFNAMYDMREIWANKGASGINH